MAGMSPLPSGVARFRGALVQGFDGGPPSISNQKKIYNTYNITNQAANLKLNHTVTILTKCLRQSKPNNPKFSYACLLLRKNIHHAHFLLTTLPGCSAALQTLYFVSSSWLPPRLVHCTTCTTHCYATASAGWQVTLCDPIWHVSSRSGVANLRTATL